MVIILENTDDTFLTIAILTIRRASKHCEIHNRAFDYPRTFFHRFNLFKHCQCALNLNVIFRPLHWQCLVDADSPLLLVLNECSFFPYPLSAILVCRKHEYVPFAFLPSCRSLCGFPSLTSNSNLKVQ